MTRRRLNWKVLLITLVLGGGVGGALTGLHAWQLNRTAKGLLVLASAQEQASEWMKATEYLDRYLRLRPDDAGARVRLALTYGRAAGRPDATLQQKERAIELHYRAAAAGSGEDELALRRGLAELLLETGRFAAAEKEAHRVLQAAGPEDAQAVRLLALALVSQLGEGSLAGTKTEDLSLVKTVERARHLNREDVRLARTLATLYREFAATVLAEYPDLTEPARFERANESLDQLVHDNPSSASARLARYEYRVKYGLAEALPDLEAALALAPEDAGVCLAAALSAQQRAALARQRGETDVAQALFEQSQKHYRQLVALPATQRIGPYYLGLGEVQLALGELETALATWGDGHQLFKQLTARVMFQSRIAEACMEAGRLAGAGEALDAIDETLDGLGNSIRRDEKARLTWEQDLRRSAWHIKRQEFADAAALLRKVVAQSKGEANAQAAFRAWLQLGSVYSSLREWRDASIAFDQANDLEPGFQPARVAAASCWLYAGRADIAGERAEQALRTMATPEAWSLLALAQFQYQLTRPVEERTWGRFEQALAEAKRGPERGATPWQMDFLSADYALARAKAAGGDAPGAEEAARVLTASEKEHASRKEFWFELCLAYQRLKREADADRALEEFRRMGGEAAEIALAESRLASMRGDDGRAKSILTDASQGASLETQRKLRQELLRVLLATKEMSQARAMLVQDHEQQPRNIAILRRLAELDLELRDFKQVAAWERTLEQEGVMGEQLARYFRAWRLFQTSASNDAPELREALRMLEQVVLAQPNWPEAAALKGMTEQRLGQLEAAVQDYERAVQLGERRVVVFEQLIALLDQLHRPADVERHLARLGADLPLSQRLAEMAADQEVRRDRPEKALEIARRNAEQRPNDPAAQLWLGRLLAITNQAAEAETAFRKATDLKPADPRGWNGLIALSLQARNRDGMQAVLKRLEANTALDAAQKSLLIGQAQAGLGNVADAKRSFVEAADRAKDDVGAQLRVAQFFMQEDPQQAKAHLEAALRIDPKSVAAKRMLAIVNASQGDLTQAERLLTETAADGTVVMEDARLHAVLLLQRGDPAHLDRAAILLEDIVSRSGAGQPIDHLLLARVYERQAQINDDPDLIATRLQGAQAQLTTLAERPQADPAHLAALVQFFVRHGKSEEAAPWLKTLEDRVDSLPRSNPDAIALLIQTQIEQGSAERAQPWLKKLEEIDSAPLRVVALRAQAALARDANANVESIVEPRAQSLVARAKTPEEKQQLLRSIGDLYMTVKKHAVAERWYRLLAAEDARQFAAVVSALVRQRQVSEAIDLCEQAAKTDSTVRPALVLATALVEGSPVADEIRRAEPIIAAALKKFDSDANLIYAVALLRITEGKNEESIELFRKVVKLNPRLIPALNNLAMMLAEKPADQAEALELIDRALAIAGKDAGLLDTKGAILLYGGRSREAMPLLESATRAPQADPRHHFHLALAYRDQGKTEQAIAQLKTALDRQLITQVLTPTDQKLLGELRSALQL